MAARDDGTVPPDQVVDVQFAAFMADPFATIGAIYDRLGLELTDEAEGRMRVPRRAPRRRGHRYTFAATGLDAGELRESPALPGALRRADRQLEGNALPRSPRASREVRPARRGW